MRVGKINVNFQLSLIENGLNRIHLENINEL